MQIDRVTVELANTHKRGIVLERRSIIGEHRKVTTEESMSKSGPEFQEQFNIELLKLQGECVIALLNLLFETKR